MNRCWLLPSLVLVGSLVVSAVATQSAEGVIVGTFDASRGGLANLANGALSSQARASLLAHYPGTTFATTPALNTPFLSGVDILVLTSPKDTVGITPLSALEQAAMLSFVQNGGRAFLIADGYSPYVPAANSLVAPFGATIIDDGVTDLQPCTVLNPAHPIFSGPFGVPSLVYMLGAGNFTSIGTYASPLATMDSTGRNVIASIEAGAIGPGSGRVLMYSDATLFADPAADGYFYYSEPLFLNSIQYLLVPEPSTLSLAGLGLLAVGAAYRARRRNRLTSPGLPCAPPHTPAA